MDHDNYMYIDVVNSPIPTPENSLWLPSQLLSILPCRLAIVESMDKTFDYDVHIHGIPELFDVAEPGTASIMRKFYPLRCIPSFVEDKQGEKVWYISTKLLPELGGRKRSKEELLSLVNDLYKQPYKWYDGNYDTCHMSDAELPKSLSSALQKFYSNNEQLCAYASQAKVQCSRYTCGLHNNLLNIIETISSQYGPMGVIR
jgi:hypothetical protein